MFYGRTSLICAQSAVIRNYGFGVLTATSGSSSCGYHLSRAVGTVDPTVTATATDDSANLEIDFNISVFTSNGNGGATVNVVANDAPVARVYTTTIAAGATSKTFSVPYSALSSGSQALKIEVIPNLPGIATATSDVLVTKAGAATTIAATVTGKANAAGSARVTVTGSSPTGTVKVYKGTSATGNPIGTGTLTTGVATIALPAQPKKGNVALFITYSGDGSNAASTKAVTWKVN
jgi:hypothetical protein